MSRNPAGRRPAGRSSARPSRLGAVGSTLALAGAGLAAVVLLYGLAQRNLVPRTEPAREANPAGLVGPVLQIEVRNGAGVEGLAATAARYLRRRGFDVVASGNWTSLDVGESFVADRAGDPAAAGRVAAALGLPPARVRPLPDSGAFVDAAVVLGRDYAALAPFADADPLGFIP